MKNITAYPTIWQTLPYSLYMIDQMKNEKRQYTKDLVLRNDDVLEKEVSEMTLNVTAISILDKNNREHYVTDFKYQVINLKGMHTGLFLRSKNGLNLTIGQYSTIRFYLGSSQNNYVDKERNIENINGVDFLDFGIKDGLEINEGQSNEITLRFDFVPYSFSSNFKPIKDFFKRQRDVFSSKLEGSFQG